MYQNFEVLSEVSVNSPEKEVNSARGGASQISFQEFFDFLACAFKLSLSPDEKSLYKELVDNEFVTKLLEIAADRFRSSVDSDGKIGTERGRLQESIHNFLQDEDKIQGIRSLFIRFNKKPSDTDFSLSHLSILEAENILKAKLDEVIDEGLLDSIFPFIIAKLSASALSSKSLEENALIHCDSFHKVSKQSNKHRIRKVQTNESEIEIQVCDEINNISKIFRCSQSLLLSKMEYFAEVTEGQKLEDMDISVHCDITIFEWLMKWVHKSSSNKDLNPAMNVNNVTPILISAMFLRMEPLVDECVKFFRLNMKEIVDMSSSFSGFSDSILEKIADTLTNVELDCLEDPQDKIQSKLFTKFIMSLSKRKIERDKGHYSSLAALFRCSHCRQTLHEDSALASPCTSEFLAVDSKGNIQGRHKEDTTWNLNSYIKQLKRELSTWKNVYWKLWGSCHYLDCVKCKLSYPLSHSLCCRYHPSPPHFPSRGNTSHLLTPVGRYVCCGARTHKFDVLGLPNGCMHRAHIPLETKFSIKIMPILEKKRGAICICPSETHQGEEKDLRNLFGWNSSWWPISRGNYLDKMHLFSELFGMEERDRESDQEGDYEAGGSGSPEDLDNASSDSEFIELASVGDEEDSENSNSSKKIFCQSKTQPPSKLWTTHRSVRFNQDNQREREERLIKSLIQKLNRNKNEELEFFMSKSDYSIINTSGGGVYAALEEEWREEYNHPALLQTSTVKPTRTRSGKYNYF